MCEKSFWKMIGAVVMVGLVLHASPAGATVMSPSNGSFELPAFDAGTNYTSALAADWQATSQNTGGMDILHHSSVSGLYAAPVDGSTIVGLESQWKDGLNLYGGIQQDLGTMAADEKYTFQATLFSNSEGGVCRYRISFYNVTDGRELAAITHADFDPSALGTNQTVAATFAYTALAADAGDTLRLIMNPSTTEGNTLPNGWAINRTGVDAVSVTTTAVPEPATMAALCSALVGLLAYAWRRRK